jgi:putative DNA primase/helicase
VVIEQWRMRNMQADDTATEEERPGEGVVEDHHGEGAGEVEDGAPAPRAGTEGMRFQSSDAGNAERLATYFSDRLRYCPELAKWLYWRGDRWLLDEDGAVTRCAKQVGRRIRRAGENIDNETERGAVIKWGLQSESARAIDAMIRLARSDLRLVIAASDLDSDPMRLGVENGTINLHTGHLQAVDQQDYITKRAPVEFDPDAECPRWLRYLEDVTGGDRDFIDFLRRVAGYCLTGLTNEQCLFILHGRGGNGKSVFIRRLQTLLGDYAMVAPAEILMKTNRGGGPTPDLARLKGARLVVASEPEEGALLGEVVVKRATGQDTIVCRFLHANPFEYLPQFKFVIATNHLPRVKGDDYAIWRRIRLLPFNVTIPEGQRDKSLLDDPTAELPAILNWALDGLRQWQQMGLAPPECVLQATKQYRDDMDTLGDWISDCCIVAGGGKGHLKDLHSSYRQWCSTSGYYPLGKKRFGSKMLARGFEKEGDRSGPFFWGIELKSTDAAAADDAGDLLDVVMYAAMDTDDAAGEAGAGADVKNAKN